MTVEFDFVSDNVVGASPEILDALVHANAGQATPYGGDEATARLTHRFQDLFECNCRVFPITTGTAANVLGLSVLTPPYGEVYCHETSHLNADECGAPEFYTGGARLVLLGGPGAKISAQTLAAQLAVSRRGDVHSVQPAALSITQQTEAGTHYTLDEISALSDIAKHYSLGFQIDGARFANAMVGLGCSPAEMTWKAGVDVLSFGASKNGALAVEAVVFFNPELVRDFEFRRKRGGHLVSKMRFLSVQLEAYLTDDLWVRNARHANNMANRLATGLAQLPGVSFPDPVQGNELFPRLPPRMLTGLRDAGFQFYDWGPPGEQLVRMITAFNTKPEDVDAFLSIASNVASAGKSPDT